MGSGGVPERSNGAVLKTVGRASVPWVRIPPPPLRLPWNAKGRAQSARPSPADSQAASFSAIFSVIAFFSPEASWIFRVRCAAGFGTRISTTPLR
jgi:hypothetical protein